MEKPSPLSIPSCREVHQLVSEGMDRELSLVERTRMRLHLLVCTACTNFNGQMALMRQAMRRREPDEPEPPTP